MSDPKTPHPENDRSSDYQAPKVESHLERDEIEREVAYAGQTQAEMSDSLLGGGD